MATQLLGVPDPLILIPPKPPDPPDGSDLIYRSTKNFLKKIIRSDNPEKATKIQKVINDAVFRINQIVTQTYLFLEAYILFCYKNQQPLPVVNQKFVTACTNILITNPNSTKPYGVEMNLLMAPLQGFFQDHYQPVMIKTWDSATNGEVPLLIDASYLTQVLAFEMKGIITNIENNIRAHYIHYVLGLVNYKFDLKKRLYDIQKSNLRNIEKKQQKSEFQAIIRLIKSDLLDFNKTTSDQLESSKDYHKWILDTKDKIIPKKDKYEEDSICYDVKVFPTSYIPGLIYINQEIANLSEIRTLEKLSDSNKHKPSETIGSEGPSIIKPVYPDHRLFHILPIRRSIIPSYITLDTSCLVDLLIESGVTKIKNNISDNYDNVWDQFFKIKSRSFKSGKHYTFSYLIRTDGIGASIQLIHKDHKDRIFTKKKRKGKKHKNKVVAPVLPIGKKIKITLKKISADKKKSDPEDTYIDKLTDEEITKYHLRERHLVGIDPNKIDIISASDILGQKFHVSSNRKRHETRSRHYNQLIDSLNKTTWIDNKTVKQLESELSCHNSKTCDYDKFMAYTKAKNQLNAKLFSHYSTSGYKLNIFQTPDGTYTEGYQKKLMKITNRLPRVFDSDVPQTYYYGDLFRKLRMNRYINTQKFNEKIITDFAKVFGGPEDIVIAFGDHSQRGQMKYHEPTMDIGMRRLFRKYGYLVYLFWEWGTSKYCYKCGSENEKFLYRENPRPWRRAIQAEVEVHGLLRCTSPDCQTVHCRDYNASQNMVLGGIEALNGSPRPWWLTSAGHPEDKTVPSKGTSANSELQPKIKLKLKLKLRDDRPVKTGILDIQTITGGNEQNVTIYQMNYSSSIEIAEIFE